MEANQMRFKKLLLVPILGLGLILALSPPLSSASRTCASEAWSKIQVQLCPNISYIRDGTPGFCSLALSALPISQVAKLVANDGGTGDTFGGAVSISGDTVVVGSSRDIVGFNQNQGSAYVFERNQGGIGQWGQVAKLIAGDGAEDDYFGISVAIAGDIIVIGAYSDDVGGHTSQGSAYIFERNPDDGDPWLRVEKLTAVGGGYYDYFGRSVAVAGDTIVVGATEGGGRGSAYIFQRDYSGADQWGQVKRLIASDGANGDRFGHTVAIAGDTVVVGGNESDVGGNTDQGAAYIFERDQDGVDQWGQVKKLTASDGAALGYFGVAVTIAGDTVVVGAYGDNSERGAAYIFERDQDGSDQWGQVKKLIADDGMEGDQFGSAVGIAGGRVVVGAGDDNVGSSADQGSAYVFERDQNGTDQWGQVEKLTAADGAAGDEFGCAAVIAGSTVVIGADHDDVGSTNYQGSAYVFQSMANVYLPLVLRQFP
jgi:hypothetical protein